MNISLVDETDAVTEDGYTWVRFKAAGAITALKVVMIDTTKTGDAKIKYVKESLASGVGQAFSVGFALDTVADGEFVRVCIHGFLENAAVATDVTSGVIVGPTSGGSVGLAIAGGASITSPPLALSLEPAVADKADVYVLNPLGLPLS